MHMYFKSPDSKINKRTSDLFCIVITLASLKPSPSEWVWKFTAKKFSIMLHHKSHYKIRYSQVDIQWPRNNSWTSYKYPSTLYKTGTGQRLQRWKCQFQILGFYSQTVELLYVVESISAGKVVKGRLKYPARMSVWLTVWTTWTNMNEYECLSKNKQGRWKYPARIGMTTAHAWTNVNEYDKQDQAWTLSMNEYIVTYMSPMSIFLAGLIDNDLLIIINNR